MSQRQSAISTQKRADDLRCTSSLNPDVFFELAPRVRHARIIHLLCDLRVCPQRSRGRGHRRHAEMIGPDAKLLAVGEIHIQQARTRDLKEVNHGRAENCETFRVNELQDYRYGPEVANDLERKMR